MYASLLHIQSIGIMTGWYLPDHTVYYNICFHTSFALTEELISLHVNSDTTNTRNNLARDTFPR